MFKRLFEQRKLLSAITAGILVIQTFLPSAWGVPKAFAEDNVVKNWTFGTPSDYTTDDNLVISHDLLHFKTTWNSTVYGTGLPNGVGISELFTASDGKVWAVLNSGAVYFSSDGGINWSLKTIIGITTAYEIAEVSLGAGSNLIAVGDTISYSTDGGDNWLASSIAGGSPSLFKAVATFTSSIRIAYAITSNNPAEIYHTGNGGVSWNRSNQVTAIASAVDIAWNGTFVVAVGNNGAGSGVLQYSVNPVVVPWDTKSLPDTVLPLTEVDYIGGKIYTGGGSGVLGGGGYVAVSVSSDPSLSWNNHSSNLPNDLVYLSDFLGNNGIPFFVGATAGREPMVYCSFNSGANWIEQSLTNRSDLGSAEWNALAVQPATGLLLMGGSLGGKNDIFLGTYSYPTSSVVATTALYNAVKITAISITEHSLSNGEARFAFSRQSTDAGEWYYYDTGTSAWTADASADDSSKANTMAELTTAVLGTMLETIPASNPALYVKIYNDSLNATGQMLIANSVTVTYNTAVLGGGGGGADTERPNSGVNPLPRYSTVADTCNPSIIVTATATDDSSGVASVGLRISTDKMLRLIRPTIIPIDTGPEQWSWKVPVEDGKTYYFQSFASDNAGNSEIKLASHDSYWVNGVFWPAQYYYDASTTINISSPYLVESNPADGAEKVPTGQSVTLEFSEYMIPDSLTYNFYSAEGEVPSSVVWSDKNEDETGAKIATITPTSNDGILLELTTYNFRIKTATDLAGNPILDKYEQRVCEPSNEPRAPLLFSFTTAVEPHPNLTSSKLQVALGSHNGKYAVDEEVEYTLHLRNSDKKVDAPNVIVTVNFAEGITYVKNGGSGFTVIYDGGKAVGLEWKGSVLKDSTVEPKFTMKVGVSGYAAQLTVEQNMTVDDSINDEFIPSEPAKLYVVPDSNFTTSKKESNKVGSVAPGTVVTYTITIYNTGSTVGDIEINDFVPKKNSENTTPGFYYVDPSIAIDPTDKRWLSVPTWNKNNETITGLAQGIQKNANPLTFNFKVVMRDVTGDTDVINTANVWDPNLNSDERTPLTATVRVSPNPDVPKDPLQIVQQNPAPNSKNNGFKQSITVGFNYPVDTKQSFEFSLSNERGTLVTKSWGQTWEDENAMFVLTAPIGDKDYDGFDGELEVGATYEVTIVSATALDKNIKPLESHVRWKFTTADPKVKITYPISDWSELRANILSAPYIVILTDQISGQQYVAEEDITLNLRAYFGVNERDSGKFWKRDSHNNLVTATVGNPVVITKGTSMATFYYKDSEPTPPPIDTNKPWFVKIQVSDFIEGFFRGWVGDNRFLTVVDTDQPLESLVISIPDTVINVNKFSAPIRITAKDAEGLPEFLPKGKIYLYSGNNTGAFYDASQRKLPYLIVAQDAVGKGIPQYVVSDGNKSSLTIYYLDSEAGMNIIVASDNLPLFPDIGFNDAIGILNVQDKLKEEELLEELEDVTDDTGRVIDKMVIKPVEAQMLPGKTQLFKATAYDTEGKPIENAKFKWFVLIDKSGKINKNGDDKTTHQSTFTAGEDLGTYYDTVMVATLYNGKIAYATASVAVVDVVDYRGPKRLPVTGMNGLQLLLLGLTLVAAVALAWVEHYDKTHFKKES